jgi:hypothetical protein
MTSSVAILDSIDNRVSCFGPRADLLVRYWNGTVVVSEIWCEGGW